LRQNGLTENKKKENEAKTPPNELPANSDGIHGRFYGPNKVFLVQHFG